MFIKQNLTKMKHYLIFVLLLVSFSSCIVEMDLNPPHVNVGDIDEYETKEVIHEVWSNGVLIYEESIYHAWLDIEFYNSGGIRAENVWAEVVFYNGHHTVQTISIDLPNLRSGHTFTYTIDTGFESMYDYSDYDINVYWD